MAMLEITQPQHSDFGPEIPIAWLPDKFLKKSYTNQVEE